MHEFSMCEDMLKTLKTEYDNYMKEKKTDTSAKPTRVVRVRLVLGELHQIVPESLLMAYQALAAETVFAGSALQLEKVPLKINCRQCGWEGEIRAPFFVCARCGGNDVATLTGREFYIADMELEDDEPKGV
jgi:hydrogenase nickel incorporation protein HypA/HybF